MSELDVSELDVSELDVSELDDSFTQFAPMFFGFVFLTVTGGDLRLAPDHRYIRQTKPDSKSLVVKGNDWVNPQAQFDRNFQCGIELRLVQPQRFGSDG